MGIKHTDVKASGEKGFAAEWNKNHVIDGDVDMAQNSWENQVLENLGAFPGGPIEGQIIYRSDLDALYVWDGTGWSQSNKRVQYWSAPPDQFQGTADTARYTIDTLYTNRALWVFGGGAWNLITCHVNLPNGAVVTAALVDGAGGDPPTWTLYRIPILGAVAPTAMASAAIGVEDVTIGNATIDNSLYAYYFGFSANAVGEPSITGARITYTL